MILVTGGAGYIGSHTCVELLNAGHDVVVVDNLVNSSIVALDRVKKITAKNIAFHEIDIRDTQKLRSVFSEYEISAVIHFAGLKAVGESTLNPLDYYDNNVAGTISLLNVMREFDCKTLVFSSSATVYGNSKSMPINESHSLTATNPYGRSKLIIEDILRDLFTANNDYHIALLRYFNPVGAHSSGLIGEDPKGAPNNLMPYIAQVAIGKRKKLQVFGDDYNTKDGTGVRDYVHVVDLAKGHVLALQKLAIKAQLMTINLGTGNGYSVLEMIKAFEAAANKKIEYEIVERRAGDADECYADAALASELINWRAQYDLLRMCEDTWRWQSMNPNGYN